MQVAHGLRVGHRQKKPEAGKPVTADKLDGVPSPRTLDIKHSTIAEHDFSPLATGDNGATRSVCRNCTEEKRPVLRPFFLGLRLFFRGLDAVCALPQDFSARTAQRAALRVLSKGEPSRATYFRTSIPQGCASPGAFTHRGFGAGATAGIAAAQLRAKVFSMVYGHMHALAGRAPDFDDLVQMAAEQVFRSLPNFEQRCAPATWTYRICYNTLLKQRRWYRRWLRRFTLAYSEEPLEESTPAERDATNWLEQRERAKRLYAALDQVSEKRRTVVILHDLEGLEIDEIAAVVRATANTVRSRLRDGRKLLARALENDPYFGDEACCKEAP